MLPCRVLRNILTCVKVLDVLLLLLFLICVFSLIGKPMHHAS